MSRYQEAILAARRAHLTVDRELSGRILHDLRLWHEDVMKALGRARGTQRARLAVLAENLDEAADAFARRLTHSTDLLRTALYSEVLGLMQAQGARIAAAGELPMGAIRPAVDVAALWSEAHRYPFRTLLRGRVASASAEVETIIRRSLLEGVSPPTLAKRLLPYMEGSQAFTRAFREMARPPAAPFTLRLTQIPPDVRGQAASALYNAERIAFTETHMARAEAELAYFMADPVVKAIRWTLAPDRGKLKGPDICDTLARSNLYGLGVGVYPLRAVPPIPHSWCRCERHPVERRMDELDEPKPRGRRNLDDAVIRGGSERQRERIQEALPTLLPA